MESMLAGLPAQTSSRTFTFPGIEPSGIRKALLQYGGRTAQDFHLIPYYRTTAPYAYCAHQHLAS